MKKIIALRSLDNHCFGGAMQWFAEGCPVTGIQNTSEILRIQDDSRIFWKTPAIERGNRYLQYGLVPSIEEGLGFDALNYSEKAIDTALEQILKTKISGLFITFPECSIHIMGFFNNDKKKDLRLFDFALNPKKSFEINRKGLADKFRILLERYNRTTPITHLQVIPYHSPHPIPAI
jgi:hypothetical protein